MDAVVDLLVTAALDVATVCFHTGSRDLIDNDYLLTDSFPVIPSSSSISSSGSGLQGDG